MEERWTFGGGSVIARMLAPEVVLVQMVGVQDDERIVRAFVDWFAKLPRRGPVYMFWDTSENSGYKTRNREALEAWYRSVKPQLAATEVLVRSKLMAMAVAIANMTAGGTIHATTDARRFQLLVDEAVRRARGSVQPSASAS
jgi:hypothetical protein